MADAQTHITAIEAFLAQNIGVGEVIIDGTKVRYERAQALQELEYWKRQLAKTTRPRVSTIGLGGAW